MRIEESASYAWRQSMSTASMNPEISSGRSFSARAAAASGSMPGTGFQPDPAEVIGHRA
jgi:hypothetical protein